MGFRAAGYGRHRSQWVKDTIQTKAQYESLSKEDKITVESILFLMDKFGVSDEFVHELSMVIKDFPIKSYLIKQCRFNLNKQVKIATTPGLAPGAQHSFKLLLAEKVKDMVSKSIDKLLISIGHFPL